MGSKTPEEHYRRLSEAVDLYLQHRRPDASAEQPDPANGSVGSLGAEQLLAQHPELRDLLVPMLDASEHGNEAETERLDSPRFFGDYELLRELGRGGMGVVFEAREVALHRRVALKLLPNGPSTSVTQIERFRREAAAAGRLQHQSIAAVHRVGECDGTHFIAMELVDGPNLAHVLQGLRTERQAGASDQQVATGRRAQAGPTAQAGPGAQEGNGATLAKHATSLIRDASLTSMPRDGGPGYYSEVVDLTASIAEALAYAHDHGVVHRDVKPHNILLGGPAGVKLVDFGLAKDLDREALTQTGDTAGTPDYMSPEQVRGGAVDARADVYALGVVLYELLTWQRPFQRESMHATLAAIVSQEAVPVRKLEPGTPRDLETICRKAMEKDVLRRYANAHALAADLKRFRRHEPIHATPPSAASRMIKLVRRNRAKTTAAVFAVLALVIAPLGFAVYFKHSRDALLAAQTETTRQRDLGREILGEARRSLDQIYAWLADDRLIEEPGLVDVRRELMERALGFYGRFQELAGGEPSLRVDAVLAELLFASILCELGEFERADQHLSRTLLQAAIPTPIGREFELAMARIRGFQSKIRIATNQSRTDSAEDLERQALQLLEALTPVDETQQAIRLHHVASLRAQRARRLLEYGSSWQAAVAELDQAIAHWQQSAELHPETPRARMQLAEALGERALIRARNMDASAALGDCDGAVLLLEALSKERVRSTAARRRLVRVLGQQSEIHQRLGNMVAATTTAERAVHIAKSIHRDYPELHSCRFLYVSAIFDLARALLAGGSSSACLEQLEIAWPIACALAKDAPRMLAASSMVGNIAGPLAQLRRKLLGASSEQTLPLHEQAVEVFEAAYSQHADSDTIRDLLALALSAYGNDLRHAGELAKARTVLARAFLLQRQNLEAHPKSAELVVQLRVIAARQMGVELADGDLQAGQEGAIRLVEALPGNAQAMLEAAEHLAQFGNAASQSEMYRDREPAWRSQCLDWLRQAIAIDAQLLEAVASSEALNLYREHADFQSLLIGR